MISACVCACVAKNENVEPNSEKFEITVIASKMALCYHQKDCNAALATDGKRITRPSPHNKVQQVDSGLSTSL
jgi:hypothetical protein